ncbi:MAG TPA: heavy metal translocating P-type ATPase, partial [Thermosynergistes sp.]|nr:heavy metal translocating P-type ATPase [Thermosynergistes sp.]
MTWVEPDLQSLDREGEGSVHVEEDEKSGNLWQIAVAGVLFLTGLIWGEQVSRTPFAWVEYVIFFSAYLLVGISVINTALRNLFHGRVFDENFLLSAASMGAIAIGQLPEAAAVMLFYALGEYLQERAEGRSRRSIAALLDMRADHANLRTGETIRRVSPEEVTAGQIIVVKPGERVPLDGEVL